MTVQVDLLQVCVTARSDKELARELRGFARGDVRVDPLVAQALTFAASLRTVASEMPSTSAPGSAAKALSA
jgi:hypothetical protein